MYLFDPQWFEEKQRMLLRFANTKIGRWFFRIHGKRSSVVGKIIKIEPNAITWKKGDEFQTEFRTHNKYSKRLFYGLYPLWWLAHQWDMVTKFAPRWNLGFDTLTVYPDPAVEVDTVDGVAIHDESTGLSWAALRDGAGTSASDTSASAICAGLKAWTTSSQWWWIRRSIFLFKTSTLTSGATISATTMSLFGSGGEAEWTDTGINIYSSAPASDTAVVAGDYDSLGTTAFATAIAYASWNGTGGENVFTINATGIAAIDRVGITKFGCRETTYDVGNTAPSWVASGQTSFSCYFADQTGLTSDPKLVVTYTNVNSASPSISPSASPSISPSKSPSASPSISPSVSPPESISPSISASLSPSASPSLSPSRSPSTSSSLSPSTSPSLSPSRSPSLSPSLSPSISASLSPSVSPSVSPSPSSVVTSKRRPRWKLI